jgi:hypothetical protein
MKYTSKDLDLVREYISDFMHFLETVYPGEQIEIDALDMAYATLRLNLDEPEEIELFKEFNEFIESRKNTPKKTSNKKGSKKLKPTLTLINC